MIPTEEDIQRLWDTYDVSKVKRIHMQLVSRVALFFADRLMTSDTQLHINVPLLYVSALLHDLDKNTEKLPGESHPDAAVRILKNEGMEAVATLVSVHPLHAILHSDTAPKTMQEKILFLSDKMVKYEIMTVDKRFALWNAEHMNDTIQSQLDQCYPRVKKLENELCTRIHIRSEDIATIIEGKKFYFHVLKKRTRLPKKDP